MTRAVIAAGFGAVAGFDLALVWYIWQMDRGRKMRLKVRIAKWLMRRTDRVWYALPFRVRLWASLWSKWEK